MKIYIYAAIILISAGFTSCGDDDKLPDVRPADRGTVTDNQGNVYEWVRIGNQMWTTTNAKNGTHLSEAEYYNNFSYTYVLPDDEDVEEYDNNYYPVYGNLMNYDDAVASAPEGWRLPSDEDWQKLEKTLGMSNPDRKGSRGNIGLVLQSRDSGCELGLGLGGACVPVKNYGWIDMSLDYVGEYGFYWTSTIDSSYEAEQTMVYFRRLTANYPTVGRECIRSDCYMSVRWVRDVE